MSDPTYFTIFSLPAKLGIDTAALEKSFYALSRRLHPDRFASKSHEEQVEALAESSRLNDAYRTLKDPLFRTEYLLKLEGAEIGEEHAGKDRKGQSDPSRVPADLLEEVFELNMQLEEMRMARSTGEIDSVLENGLVLAKKKFESLLAAVDLDLRTEWKAWDTGDAAARKTSEKSMVALLDRRRYLRNLVRDVTETLGA
jgi:molecular chaperone HscB